MYERVKIPNHSIIMYLSAGKFVSCWRNGGERDGKIFDLLGKIRLVLDLLNLALR